MKALQFSASAAKFLVLKPLGALFPFLFYKGPLATIRLVDIAEPALPGPDWVKLRTLLCGFCGSDQSLIFLKDSPTASPFTSFPCVLGHELCGEIVEIGKGVTDLKIGDRVTVSPGLTCTARGINPACPSCRSGRPGSCENTAKGHLSPGMFTGICRDIGGGFAPYLVAHKSQIYKLPEGISPETASMTEPLGVTLQAVMDNRPVADDKVLVIGGGVIGNLIVQSIRAFGISCSITVVEPSLFHAELAVRAGADHIVTDGDIAGAAIQITGAESYKPILGKSILMGGFTRIFDCVGHTDTLRAAMRSMAGGGTLSVVGIGDEVKFDLTPLWLKLQTIKGVYAHGVNLVDGRQEHVFETALRFSASGRVRLHEMVTHKFPLTSYQEMIEVNMRKSANRAVKTSVFFT
ncbi:MAG: alcohol dehydrogenase catalytic domain-containing protein [Desulfobacterales bacterium]